METRFAKFKENPENASFNDLLSIIVGGVNSVKGMNVVSETTSRYMKPLGGTDDLSYLDLMDISGMTENKALKIAQPSNSAAASSAVAIK